MNGRYIREGCNAWACHDEHVPGMTTTTASLSEMKEKDKEAYISRFLFDKMVELQYRKPEPYDVRYSTVRL